MEEITTSHVNRWLLLERGVQEGVQGFDRKPTDEETEKLVAHWRERAEDESFGGYCSELVRKGVQGLGSISEEHFQEVLKDAISKTEDTMEFFGEWMNPTPRTDRY